MNLSNCEELQIEQNISMDNKIGIIESLEAAVVIDVFVDSLVHLEQSLECHDALLESLSREAIAGCGLASHQLESSELHQNSKRLEAEITPLSRVIDM